MLKSGPKNRFPNVEEDGVADESVKLELSDSIDSSVEGKSKRKFMKSQNI